MGFDLVCEFTDDGLRQSRDLVAFFRKRQAIEQDYAKALCESRCVPHLLAHTYLLARTYLLSHTLSPSHHVIAAKLSSQFKALVPESKREVLDRGRETEDQA